MDRADLDSRYQFSLLLEPRSLLVLKDDMYTNLLHGITPREEDTITGNVSNLSQCSSVTLGQIMTRSTRVSLTIRYVPKTLKVKLKLGK